MLKINHYLSLTLLLSIPAIAMDRPESHAAHARVFNAIRSGNVNELRTIEKANPGIAFNRITENGMPLLVIAAIHGTPDMMHYLLRTVRLNSNTPYNGQNLLHIATAHNRFEMVKYLIEVAKFDTNAADAAGLNALDIAKQKKNERIIKYLVAAINTTKIKPTYKPRPAKEIIFDELESDEFLIPTPAVKAASPVATPPAPTSVKPVEQPKPVLKSCIICAEDRQPDQFITLGCGHESCRECLGFMLDSALKEKNTRAFKCPIPECKHLLENDISKISADHNKYAQFSDIQLQEWLTKQETVKNCPTTDCPFSFINERADQFTMQCPDCKKEYCGKCLHPHNPRISCQHAEQERNLANDKDAQEKANAKWVAENTRACPKCKASIEKNEGCNHMTCKKCNHEFCWLCLTNWYGHNYQICQANAVAQAAPQPQQAQSEERITWENAHLFFARDPRGFVNLPTNTFNITMDFAERFMRLSCEDQGLWTARIAQLLENDRHSYFTFINNHNNTQWVNELNRLEPFRLSIISHQPTQDGTFRASFNINREVSNQLMTQIQQWIIEQNPQEMILFTGWNSAIHCETSLSRERLQEVLNQASNHFKNNRELLQAETMQAPASRNHQGNAPINEWADNARPAPLVVQPQVIARWSRNEHGLINGAYARIAISISIPRNQVTFVEVENIVNHLIQRFALHEDIGIMINEINDAYSVRIANHNSANMLTDDFANGLVTEINQQLANRRAGNAARNNAQAPAPAVAQPQAQAQWVYGETVMRNGAPFMRAITIAIPRDRVTEEQAYHYLEVLRQRLSFSDIAISIQEGNVYFYLLRLESNQNGLSNIIANAIVTEINTRFTI